MASSRDDADSAAGHERFVEQMGETVRTRVAIGPLDEAATAELVNEQLGGALADGDFARQIHVRSAGNPFAAVEYVRAVLHAGLISASWGVVRVDQAGLDEISLPDDVLELVLARVSDLGADARWLLTAGAAMGTRFRPAALTDVLGYDDSRVACAVSDALRERLIERVDVDECAYVHDRIREALLDPLSPDHLQALHQRIAETLEARGADGPDDVFAIARHYALGEHEKAPERLYTWSVRAGEAALAGFAATEGAEFFARADDVAHAAGISHDADFYETWGALQLGRGDLDAGREKLTLALELSEDSLQRARINRLLARAEGAVFNSKEATRYALAGLRELGQTPPSGGLAMVFGILAATLRCLSHDRRTAPGPRALRRRARPSVGRGQPVPRDRERGLHRDALGRDPVDGGAHARAVAAPRPVTGALAHAHRHLGRRRLVRQSSAEGAAVRTRELAMAEAIGDPQAIAHARLYEMLGLEAIGDARAAGALAERLLPEYGRWLDLSDLLDRRLRRRRSTSRLRGHGRARRATSGSRSMSGCATSRRPASPRTRTCAWASSCSRPRASAPRPPSCSPPASATPTTPTPRTASCARPSWPPR